MLDIVFDALSVSLILLGVFFLIFAVFARLIAGRGGKGYTAVILGKADDERLAQKVYAVNMEINLFSFIRHNKVLVIDCGVRDEIKKECCELMQCRYEDLFIAQSLIEKTEQFEI